MKAKKSNRSFATSPAPALSRPPRRNERAEAPASLEFLFDRRQPWIMGVVNVTPDSFYAGSRCPSVPQALARVEQQVRDGADVLDIGGESTRPGADPIPVEEEIDRVLPVLNELRRRGLQTPVSVDTQKSAVARAALAAGAALINDISALRQDPEMADVIAQERAAVVLMHMQGTPATMQRAPRYNDVVSEVKAFLEERMAYAVKRGIAETRLILDPGIGFGKQAEHNVALLQRLGDLASLGRPLLIGLSRKMFLGRLAAPASPPLPPEDRLEASLAAYLFALQRGAAGLRTHDVGALRRAMNVWQALGTTPSDSPSKNPAGDGGRRS